METSIKSYAKKKCLARRQKHNTFQTFDKRFSEFEEFATKSYVDQIGLLP